MYSDNRITAIVSNSPRPILVQKARMALAMLPSVSILSDWDLTGFV